MGLQFKCAEPRRSLTREVVRRAICIARCSTIKKAKGTVEIMAEENLLVDVFVGSRPDGRPVFESLHVQNIEIEGGYRLLRGPLMALGVARNDVFWIDNERCISQVNKAGDFHALQLVLLESLTERNFQYIAEVAQKEGGSLDACDEPVVALSLPFSFSPAQVEAVVQTMSSRVSLEAWWVSSESALVSRDH